MKRSGTRCEYHCHWMPAKDYINSWNFKDKKKVNIKPDFKDQKFSAKQVFLGPLPFDIQDVEWQLSLLQVKFKPIFTDRIFTPPEDPRGIWSFDAEDQVIRREKVPGKDTPGDLRISYKVLQSFERMFGVNMTAVGEFDGKRLEKLDKLLTIVTMNRSTKE